MCSSSVLRDGFLGMLDAYPYQNLKMCMRAGIKHAWKAVPKNTPDGHIFKF